MRKTIEGWQADSEVCVPAYQTQAKMVAAFDAKLAKLALAIAAAHAERAEYIRSRRDNK
jgi:hypothetical protein